MSLSNLPPGCSPSDIPGNRPEDAEYEAFWNELDTKFSAEYKGLWVCLVEHEWADPQLERAVIAYVDMARDIGYDRGYKEGTETEKLAYHMREREDEFLND